MRNPVLPVLFMAALVQSGAGCIISSDDDDDGGDGTPPDGILVQMTWLCPPDADVVTITATEVGSSTSLEPDTISCDTGALDLLLDAGDWDIDVLPEGADI